MPIDNTPRPAPARKAARTPARPAAPRVPRNQARREAVDGLFKVISLGAVMRGLYADAGAIADHGPRISAEVADLADANEQMASIVDYLTEAGPYMGFIVVTLPLVFQLAANHGRIDASKLPPASGIVPPDILENRVKSDMQIARAEMMQRAHDAARQADEAVASLTLNAERL